MDILDSEIAVSVSVTILPASVGISKSKSSQIASTMVARASGSSAGEKVRMKDEDYSKMCDWLENTDNFAQLHGSGRRTKVGGKYQSKKTVFSQMLVVLHAAGFIRECKDGENLQQRHVRYLKRYKEALDFKMDSGGGLTDSEIDAGLTLEDTLNAKCPHFDRMHTIYGERANLLPPALASFGMEASAAADLEVLEDAVDLDEDMPQSPGNNEPGDTEILSDHNAGWGENPEDDEGWTQMQANPSAMETESQSAYDNVEVPTATRSQMPTNANRTPPLRSTSVPRAEASDPATDTQATPPPRRARLSPPVPPRHRTLVPNQASSKPNLASVYAEKQFQKSEYLKDMVDSKRKWKEAELADRRDARYMNALESAKQLRISRKHQREVDADNGFRLDRNSNLDRLHQADSVERQHTHQLEIIKAERKTQLWLELFRSNKPPEVVENLMQAFGRTDV